MMRNNRKFVLGDFWPCDSTGDKVIYVTIYKSLLIELLNYCIIINISENYISPKNFVALYLVFHNL